MSLLHPILAGVGIACIAIPVLIHILFRRRRRPMAWGAMRFLREAYRRQRRRLALEQWLLLALRCLAILLIALAVGGLILGDRSVASGPRDVVVVIDNSLASSAETASETAGQSALVEQIEAARGVIAALGPADRVGVITSGAPVRAVVYPPSTDRQAVAELLESIEATDGAHDPAAALELIDQPGIEAIILSAWRSGSLPESVAAGLAPERTVTLAPPAEAGLDNATVAAVVPARSTIPLIGDGGRRTVASQVRVVLERSGPWVDRELERTVRLSLVQAGGTVPAGSATARFAANERRTEIVVPIAIDGAAAGLGVIRATIDADALAADNQARAPLELREQLGVALVGRQRSGLTSVERFGQTDWLSIALAPRPRDGVALELVDPAALDRSRLRAFDAIVLAEPAGVTAEGWRVLADAVEAGALLAVFPSSSADAQDWAQPMRSAFSLDASIALEPASVSDAIEPRAREDGLLALLAGELEELAPWVSIERLLDVEAGGMRIELASAAGRPLVLSIRPSPRSGLLVLSTLALDTRWSDLPLKPLVVPLVQELVRQGIAGGATQRTGLAGEVLEVSASSLDRLEPAGRAAIRDGVLVAERSGAWLTRDGRGRTQGVVAINAPAPSAGTDAADRETVAARLAPIAGEVAWLDAAQAPRDGGGSQSADAANHTLPLTLFLIAAMLGLLEAALARQASHATTARASEQPRAEAA